MDQEEKICETCGLEHGDEYEEGMLNGEEMLHLIFLIHERRENGRKMKEIIDTARRRKLEADNVALKEELEMLKKVKDEML